ncbi:hypothetical protein [Clostridium sp. BJN0001]|uniref:hypothetical protein n=1 Tax=Clostridium sp. BJN0001 TaxID=2930219 RepID=UPI001FD51A44|nr:hypothetical protein [Clostridium sp. BJN0001]
MLIFKLYNIAMLILSAANVLVFFKVLPYSLWNLLFLFGAILSLADNLYMRKHKDKITKKDAKINAAVLAVWVICTGIVIFI